MHRITMTIKEFNKIVTDAKVKAWTSKGEGFEAFQVVKASYKEKNANELTKSIIAFIKFYGGQAERVNTIGVYRKGKQVENCLGQRYTIGGGYTPTTATKGSADIHAIIRGRSVKIEVKYGKDRMSEAQIKYKEEVERAGGVYIVARSFEQTINELQNILKIIE